MENLEREHCPHHPDLEPVEIVVNRIYSAQGDYPQAVVTELRCPAGW